MNTTHTWAEWSGGAKVQACSKVDHLYMQFTVGDYPLKMLSILEILRSDTWTECTGGTRRVKCELTENVWNVKMITHQNKSHQSAVFREKCHHMHLPTTVSVSYDCEVQIWRRGPFFFLLLVLSNKEMFLKEDWTFYPFAISHISSLGCFVPHFFRYHIVQSITGMICTHYVSSCTCWGDVSYLLFFLHWMV